MQDFLVLIRVTKRLRCIPAFALLLCVPLLLVATPNRLNAQNASADSSSAQRNDQGNPPSSSSSAADSASSDAQNDADLAAALPRGKKLILKDGSFQIVREYQREGDRVRYYSLEQSAWEEIPDALIDWDATKKTEADEQLKQDALSKALKAQEQKAQAQAIDTAVDKSFEVRPGIILPDAAGLYAVDGNAIVLMDQNKIEIHIDAGREAAKMITGPMLSSRAFVDLAGKNAKTRVHSTEPEFYFRPADGRMPQLTLMRTEPKGDKRQLETMTTDLVGQVSYKGHDVSLLFWQAANGLFRFTVEQKLEPGEYALVEITDKGQATYVWDFGVSPGNDSASKSGKAQTH